MSLLPHDVALAATAGLGLGELFAERRRHSVVEVSGGAVRVTRHRDERGVGIRAATGDGCRYVYITGLDPDLVPALRRSLTDPDVPVGPGADVEPAEPADTGPAVEIAHAAEAAAHAATGLPGTEVLVRIVEGEQSVLVATADRVAEETRRYAAFHVHVTVHKGRSVRRCRRSAGARDLAGIADPRSLAVAAAEAAVRQLDAVRAPSEELPVVLAPGGPAMLLHEACGHALEADLANRPGSAYGTRLGQRVAAPAVSLVDDPGLPGDAPLYGVDDEGEPSAPTVLVDRGVLRAHLCDRTQAARGGGTPNGHARRAGYAYPPIVRMASTVVLAGEDDPDAIVRDTARGIYVRQIGGGDTDMGSGRFNLQVEEGYLIEGGRVTAPIRGTMLSGHGPQVLASIDRVGSDLEILGHTYLCGKLDQFPLVVNLGQPTVRVAGMRVWGG